MSSVPPSDTDPQERPEDVIEVLHPGMPIDFSSPQNNLVSSAEEQAMDQFLMENMDIDGPHDMGDAETEAHATMMQAAAMQHMMQEAMMYEEQLALQHAMEEKAMYEAMMEQEAMKAAMQQAEEGIFQLEPEHAPITEESGLLVFIEKGKVDTASSAAEGDAAADAAHVVDDKDDNAITIAVNNSTLSSRVPSAASSEHSDFSIGIDAEIDTNDGNAKETVDKVSDGAQEPAPQEQKSEEEESAMVQDVGSSTSTEIPEEASISGAMGSSDDEGEMRKRQHLRTAEDLYADLPPKRKNQLSPVSATRESIALAKEEESVQEPAQEHEQETTDASEHSNTPSVRRMLNRIVPDLTPEEKGANKKSEALAVVDAEAVAAAALLPPSETSVTHIITPLSHESANSNSNLLPSGREENSSVDDLAVGAPPSTIDTVVAPVVPPTGLPQTPPPVATRPETTSEPLSSSEAAVTVAAETMTTATPPSPAAIDTNKAPTPLHFSSSSSISASSPPPAVVAASPVHLERETPIPSSSKFASLKASRIPRLKSSRYPHAKAAVNEGDPFLALVAHPQPLSVEKKQAPTSEPSEEDNGFLSALLVASGVDVRTSIRATAALRSKGLSSAAAVLGARRETFEALTCAGVQQKVAKGVINHIKATKGGTAAIASGFPGEAVASAAAAAAAVAATAAADVPAAAIDEKENPVASSSVASSSRSSDKPAALGVRKVVSSTNLSAKVVSVKSTKPAKNLRMDPTEWARKAKEKKEAAKALRDKRMFGLGESRMADTTAGLGPGKFDATAF
jgi:hypothetical protein